MTDQSQPPQPTLTPNPAVTPTLRPAPAADARVASVPLTHSSPATGPAGVTPVGVKGYKEGAKWAGNTRYVCEGTRLGRPCGFDELNESRMIDHVLAEHPEIA